jgi:hypothetical protein
MAASTILLVEDICVQCGRNATIACEVRGAVPNESEKGAVADDREYTLGDQSIRWGDGDVRFGTSGGVADRINDDGTVDAYCNARCRSCGATLVVGLRFRDRAAVATIYVDVDPPESTRP